MLYSCTHTATVGVKGLTYKDDSSESAQRSVTDVRALTRYRNEKIRGTNECVTRHTAKHAVFSSCDSVYCRGACSSPWENSRYHADSQRINRIVTATDLASQSWRSRCKHPTTSDYNVRPLCNVVGPSSLSCGELFFSNYARYLIVVILTDMQQLLQQLYGPEPENIFKTTASKVGGGGERRDYQKPDGTV